MIDQLKDLKDTYEIVRSAIDKCREPKQELIALSNFLQTIAAEPAIINEKVDKDYKRYFYEDFTQGLLKRLLREKSNDEKYLDVIAQILESFMLIFLEALKQGTLNQVFLDGVKTIFEYDNLLHCYNYLISEDQLKEIRLAGQTWRKDIKVGDQLDAIQDEYVRCPGWSQAVVSHITGDTLQLQFLCDEKTADKYMDRNSMELAPFETKSKRIFEWKNTLKPGDLIDCFDKNIWNKSTILDIQERAIGTNRTIKVANVAYRIYVERGMKIDENGKAYDGYSSKYDEWIALYSPRIQPFYTKTQRTFQDELDIDDDFDLLYPVENGHEKVYAVPRPRRCTSRVYIHLLNEFGHRGGFELIKQAIQKACSPKQGDDQTFDLNMIGTLVELVSKPYIVYNREFQKQYCSEIVNLAQQSIRAAADKSLRDINKDRVEGVIRSIDNLLKRLMTKEEREKQIEVLKLEICLLCLKSSLLEKRIQGIRDLNQIIRNNRIISNKFLTNQFLIQWMKENEVLSIIFDPKRTHLQIVQRTNDILKLLLQEDQLDLNLFEKFWSLSRTDYKAEVYKILNDIAFYMKPPHFQFIYSQIMQSNVEKLSLDDYQCLNELTKYAKDEQFKENVNKFFWDIICKTNQFKASQLIVTGMNFVRTNKIQLYKKLHAPAVQQPQTQINGSTSINADEESSIQVSAHFNVIGENGRSEQSDENKQNENIEKEILNALINNLRTYCALANEKVTQQPELLQEQRKKIFICNQKYSHHEEIDERLQFIKYLTTVSYDFKITKNELDAIYQLLVVESKIPSDAEEFLIWCKSLCEQSSLSQSVLDLTEVGEFFTEKMKSKELDLKSLPTVGFEFLQHYFLSVNEKGQKLFKSSGKNKQQSKFVNQYNFSQTFSVGGMYSGTTYSYSYGNSNNNNRNKQQQDDDKAPVFKLIRPPSELDQLDIVWNIALQSENPQVIPKAINFLIRVYYQLDEDLSADKILIQDELINKCMDLIQNTQDEFTLNRLIEIIKNIIYEAEKKGTGDVQPHNAVLKGELLERIQIRNRANSKKNNIFLSIYSNTTVWEFKKEVAKQLDLGPKYLKLERNNGQILKDLDNGKTLAEIGIQSHETIQAFKLFVEEQVANAPLIGPDQKLVEKARLIFNEWFDKYSNEEGKMTKETCCGFIHGCTGEYPPPTDDRIVGLFQKYDSNKDGIIERHEFLKFYETAARDKPDTVRENLRAHNIRGDLKKLSEIQEESSFKTEDMPRYKISENQSYFDQLMNLLDRTDSVSQSSWDLIQMLATNQALYRRVLELTSVIDKSTGKIDWNRFFDTQSDYKLLYTLQIIEAVMEEGEGENLERIIVIDDTQEKNKQKPNAPAAPGSVVNGVVVPPPTQNNQQSNSNIMDIAATKDGIQEEEKQQQQQVKQPFLKKHTSIIKDENVNSKLKSDWTQMFITHDGIQYIMKVFMQKEIKVDEKKGDEKSFSQTFELKHIAFLLKLLRIFIMAAFSTSKESQIYEAANLVRKSSNIEQDQEIINQVNSQQLKEIVQQEEMLNPQEGSRFKELQALLRGPLGQEIIDQIDYKALQDKILRTTSQILQKSEMIFEDKLIIENALSLWVGCILHHNDLFIDFKAFTCNTVQKIDDLILQGLLYCEYEKVREEFKQSLQLIAQKLSNTKSQQLKGENSPLRYLLQFLSSNFEQTSKHHSKQYFDLFCQVIDLFFEQKKREEREGNNVNTQSFNPELLLSQTIDKIREYNDIVAELNITEQQNEDENAGQNNKYQDLESVYIGLLQLSGKIIENFDISLTERIIEQKQFIEEIFSKFLFATILKEGQKIHEKKEIKIQPKKKRQTNKVQILGKKSKDAAYKLLNRLIERSPLLMNNFLDKCMLPLMNSIRRPESWNFSPNGSTGTGVIGGMQGERFQKYVGLRNLGCICYMNSMLQQFFMIPAFRYNLLCVDDKKEEKLTEYKGKMVDDNVLHQLQKLISHLELSERSDYNPFEFCFAFKDLDGVTPTNTGEQKDCQEFLNLVFDRVENLLKETSRKYLLQSVFGGQTCSQLVCQECGYFKNRIEDFYNLSLTVKDIKSMHESLQKLVDGEVINEYQCDGCKKKVDVSKRTLLSQTPNVLIVHLQRIVFNFDTFRNDKLNTFFEFPYQLDLKPYSFYEVMRKEKRIKTKKEDEDDEGEEEQKETTNDTQQEGQANEDQQWPIEDDCYEYKLVGTTVHSGSAHAGHYWSYINTCRGYLEPDENDVNWNKTENEPWMEFNDSRVSEFNFEKLRDECFGDQQKGTSSGGYDSGWSTWDSYGKSAYMLIYERRKKRPIKIVVTEQEAEEAKSKGENVIHDEKKNEYIKLIDYREGVEDIAPNKIYKQVHEDNKKFEFDNDIYSTEFFDFLKSILAAGNKLINNGAGNSQEEVEGVAQKVLALGKKAAIEILARCYNNNGLSNIVDNMIETMKANDNLCVSFMHQCFKEDNFDHLLTVILECPDMSTRQSIGNLLKFLINRLKLKEKDILYETESEEIEFRSQDGQLYKRIEVLPKALSARFIFKCIENFNSIIAKNWARFDNLLDVIYTFGVGDEEELKNLSPEDRKAQENIGQEFLFRQEFIGKACDFILGKRSPLSSPNDRRYEMGGTYAYTSPNFSPIVKLITRMINNDDLNQKYPLSDIEKKLLLTHDFMKVMLGQNQGSKLFGKSMASICRNNLKQSKKASKIFLKLINQCTYDNVKNFLKALKPFLLLDDQYKSQRLEWVFGFPSIITRREYMDNRTKFGLEMVQKMHDEVYSYVSPITSGPSEEALLNQLVKFKQRQDNFAINCVKEMISLMVKDDVITRFMYSMVPYNYQMAHFTDWMKDFLTGQRSELEKNSQYAYMKQKYETVMKALKLLTKVEVKWNALKEEEKKQYEEFVEKDKSFTEDFLAYKNEDVISYFPPQLVIGRIAGEEKILEEIDNDPLVKVTISMLTNEYNYSNPTGYFNLSIPHIELKTGMYQTISYPYYKKMVWQQERNMRLRMEEEKREREMQELEKKKKDEQNEQQEQQEEEIKEQSSQRNEQKAADIVDEATKKAIEEVSKIQDEYVDAEVRNWHQTKKEGNVLIKVIIANKSRETVKFKLQMIPKNPNAQQNVILPVSEFSDTLYQGEVKVMGYLQRINPLLDWSEVTAVVRAQMKTYGNTTSYNNNVTSSDARAAASSQFKINVYDQSGNIQADSGSMSVSLPKMVTCINCRVDNEAKSLKCSGCGNFITSGSTYDPQDDDGGNQINTRVGGSIYNQY